MTIMEIINEWDPIEFFPMAPQDEYSGEVCQIKDYMCSNDNVDVGSLAIAIDYIFSNSFGKDVYKAGLNECKLIAEKILNTKLT